MNTETQESTRLGTLLGEIRKILPDTADYIEVLFSTLADFEGVDVYKAHPGKIADCVSDIDELADEVTKSMKIELSDKAPKGSDKLQTVKDLFSELHDLLSSGPNVYKYFLKGIFELLGTQSTDFGVERREHVYSRYIVPNILLNKTEMERFFNAIGLTKLKEGGRGSHEKWTDSTDIMKGFALTAYSGKMWLKNEIKDLMRKGMPIERIRAACESCNIRFEEK